MRILSVTQSYAPFYELGGPPVKVETLASGLARRGHEITVLTTDWGYQDRRKQDPADAAAKSIWGWTREKLGVKSIYLPARIRYRSLTWNPAATQFCRVQLGQFEVVHIFGLYDLLGPTVARECRKCKIPYVVEPIGMFVPIVRSIFLKRLYHALFGKEMLRGAAAMIATAEQELEELAAGGIPRERIVLRRNGVIVPDQFPAKGAFREKFGVPRSAQMVLFLGRLSAKKSPEMLLEAIAQLPAEISGRPVWLVFAGPDQDGMRLRLDALARKHSIKNRLVFSGAIFSETKWAAYRDADVFVLPSQNENFGNTAAEAAACGTPVVVTESCGIAPLIAGKAGIAVRHETAELAGAVQAILESESLRARFSEGGKLAAARMSWQEPVEEMEKLYSRLAAPPKTVAQSAGPA
jgi:glycosyltransferase involved in cell wall biosynthesis